MERVNSSTCIAVVFRLTSMISIGLFFEADGVRKDFCLRASDEDASKVVFSARYGYVL